MWEVNHKESWTQKNWLWNAVPEKTSESPLDSKEINPVNPKGNQPWIFIGRTIAGAPIFWPPVMKSRLIGKNPDAGNDRSQKESGWQKMRWVNNITGSMNMSLSKLLEFSGGQGSLGLQFTGSQWVGHDLMTEQQQETTTTLKELAFFLKTFCRNIIDLQCYVRFLQFGFFLNWKQKWLLRVLYSVFPKC